MRFECAETDDDALQVQCSPYLKFFLCTVYVPVCTMLHEPVPPCRSLCLDVKAGCEGLMNRFGYRWPHSLDCDKFPPSGGLCVDANRSAAAEGPGEPQPAPPPPPPGRGRRPRASCPPRLVVPAELGYRLDVDGETLPDCGLPCDGDDAFVDGRRRRVVRLLVGAASAACVASSLFTLLTFVIDPSRFRYPERSIVFLSACYLGVGTAYVVGFAVGPAVACVGPFEGGGGGAVVTQGAQHGPCSAVFALLYFFGMSASIWWVVLALTWFLAAGLKWGREAIEGHAPYFHLAAWAMPAVQTFAALGTGSVGGDPVAGVCVAAGVAGGPRAPGTVFLLAPLGVYLSVGGCFMLAGVVSLFRIRSAMRRHDGSQTAKLERLMVRIGVFGVLYAVPAAVVIACHAHDLSSSAGWIRRWHALVSCPAADRACRETASAAARPPDFAVLVTKYVMTLLVGITSGFWIWSGKTLAAWRGLYARLCRGATSNSSSRSAGPAVVIRTNTSALKPPQPQPPVMI